MRYLMFKDEYHPQVKKDLKGLDKQVYIKVKTEFIFTILENPFHSEELFGNLAGIYSFHFKINKVEYRIAYFINEKNKTLFFIKIGKRENFYEEIKKRI